MIWWWPAACFILTGEEIRAHNEAILDHQADTGSAPTTLTVTGKALREFEGARVYGLVRRGNHPISDERTRIEGGRFALEFPDPLEIGERYRVDLLFDLDDDGTCSGTDAAFRINVAPDQGGPLEVALDPEVDHEPDACASF